MVESGVYYDGARLLSYNKLFNFVVGMRGGGKTYNSKHWAIRDFLKTGAQFVWVRRYKTEFKKNKEFFSDIQHEFPGVEFKVKGGEYLINGKVAGFRFVLSTSRMEKSTAFPQVNKIIFDEFILDEGVYRYLPNEVETFLDLYETVARDRDVRVLFIANAVSVINPYFVYFGFKLKPGAKFTRGDEWCVEMYMNEVFAEKKRNTRFGKMIDKTRYGAYNIDNKFKNDSDEFLERPTGKMVYWCTIVYEGDSYGIWYNEPSGYLYVTNKKDVQHKMVYCFTTDDHMPNVLLLKSIKNRTMFKSIRDAYEMSLVRFADQKCKTKFYEYMKLL